MQQIEIDELTRNSLQMEVFNLLHYPKVLRERKYVDKAYEKLYELHQYGDRMYDGINVVFSSVNRLFNLSLSGPVTISYNAIIWEYIYILSYYLHWGDNSWNDYLARIRELLPPVLRDETVGGEGLVNEFYRRRGIDPEERRVEIIPDNLTSPFRSYMFDLGLFTDKNGKPLQRQKTSFMVMMGKLFDSDFEKFAQIVNKAGEEDGFLNVFQDMLTKAEERVLS